MFDKDKKNSLGEIEEWVKINNRYAHKNYYNNSEEGMKIQLEQYIKEVMKLDKISPLIKRQIEKFNTDNNYSYKSMLFTLKYFYGIKKEELPDIAKNSKFAMGGLYETDPHNFSDEDILAILEKSYK